MNEPRAEAGFDPSVRSQILQWKQSFGAGRTSLKERFFISPKSGVLLRALARLVDAQLRTVWAMQQLPDDVALLAVGGYGRGELYPYSDIDLLILLPESPGPALQEQLETLIGTLWDIGLEVGHSVRTVEECTALSQEDITIQTTLLESRLLAGNRALYQRFLRAFSSGLDPSAFAQAKQLEQQQRHARFRESNLEPNIKESPGGLRDLHNVRWIARASGMGTRWQELVAAGVITPEEGRELQRHEHFLQSLRVRLHYQANRREDRLLFDHQSALAAQFGLADRADRLASEQLMQRYYRSAKVIMQLNTIILEDLTLRMSAARQHVVQPLNERFEMRDELLEVRSPDLFDRQPSAILESFVLLQQHHELKGIGPQTLRALWRARSLINPAFRRSPANRALFMRILRSPSRVIREIRRMHECGILGRYIPAFGHIVGQMQHDLYHVYTVDEHILKVVRNLRRFARDDFAHEFPLCSRLMSEFPQPELLYLAGLFHDIAKGRGGDHSQLGRGDALRFCRAHGIAREDAELVAWLVEMHLVMSATAQKQDLGDPDVIKAFADRVRDERRLTALYLLTVADIRGTSPKVWNAWKGKLLEDLYHATRRLLSGEHTSPENSVSVRQDEARAKLRLYAVADGAYDKFWAKLDTSYFLRHDAQEIAWHTRLLYYRVDVDKPVVKARISPAGEGLQVMVYVPDQPELFARICAFFEKISYDIFEAKVYTTRHGYALDSFQVQDPDNHHPQYRDLISFIEYELTENLLARAPLPEFSRPRLSRQLRHFPITPEVLIQPDERGTHHVLSVIAGDRPGLLSRIARMLNAYDLSLHTAKINTLGSRAEDVFLINGPALADQKTVVRFESALVEQLRT